MAIKSAKNPQLIDDVIVLAEEQVDCYLYGCLTLKHPDGTVLDVISRNNPFESVQQGDNKSDALHLISFLEGVMVNSSGGLELNENAVAGLADLLTRIQNLLRN